MSALINALVSSGFGLFVYLKNRKSPVNRLWAIFSLTIAFWSYSYFFWQISSERYLALFWCRSLMAGAIFIPVTCLHFLLVWLNVYREKKKLLFVGYAISLIAFSLNFTHLFVKDVAPISYFKFWPQASITYLPFLIFWIWLVFCCLHVMFQAIRISTGVSRNQVKYVLFSTIVGFAGGFTNYPLWFGIKIPPYGNILVSVYVVIMGYAIVAYHLMDINVVITKGLAYGALTAIIAGVYIGLMAGADRLFAAVAGYNPTLVHSLLFIVVFFALIYVLPQMKIRAIELTRHTLFRGKYDYQQELSEATRVIPTMLNLEQLGGYILTKVKDTMIVDRLSLFVYDENEHLYRLLASSGLDKAAVSEIKIGKNSALAGLLRDSANPLLKEELERIGTVPQEAFGLAVEHLNALRAELCVPLMLKDDLSGIVTLSNKRNGEMFTDEDLQLLATLARQVALTIEYIKAIDKISSEKRYVGLGKASMRMAHDIKNPLVPLKTFLQLLPDKYPEQFAKMTKIDKEFTGRFYQSALEGVDRINNLIERALHFARHPEPQFSEVKLDNLLDDVLTQEEVDLKKAKVQLEKQYSSSNDGIKADREQLFELFSNLIANGIEAMEEAPGRKLFVKTQPFNSAVAIEIVDTGCGIPREKIGTIFDPFITYKHRGSGLGLAIVKKIVDEHRGTIEVNSEIGKGTSFKVILPRRQ